MEKKINEILKNYRSKKVINSGGDLFYQVSYSGEELYLKFFRDKDAPEYDQDLSFYVYFSPENKEPINWGYTDEEEFEGILGDISDYIKGVRKVGLFTGEKNKQNLIEYLKNLRFWIHGNKFKDYLILGFGEVNEDIHRTNLVLSFRNKLGLSIEKGNYYKGYNNIDDVPESIMEEVWKRLMLREFWISMEEPSMISCVYNLNEL